MALRATTLWAPRVRGGRKESDADPMSRPGLEQVGYGSSSQYHTSLHGPLSIENDIRTIEMSKSKVNNETELRGSGSFSGESKTRKKSQSVGQLVDDDTPPGLSSHRGADFGSYQSDYDDDEGDGVRSPLPIFHDDVKEEEERKRRMSLNHIINKASNNIAEVSNNISTSIKALDIKSSWSSKLNQSSQPVCLDEGTQTSKPLMLEGGTDDKSEVAQEADKDKCILFPLVNDNVVSSNVSVSKTVPLKTISTSGISRERALSIDLVVPGRVLHMYRRMGATIPALTPLSRNQVLPECLYGVDPHVAMVSVS